MAGVSWSSCRWTGAGGLHAAGPSEVWGCPASGPGRLTVDPVPLQPALLVTHVSGTASLLRLAQGPPRVPGWGASSRWAVRDRAGGMQDLVALMSPHLPGRISPLASGSVPAMSLVFRDDLTSGVSWGRNLKGVTLGPGSMSRPHSRWYVLCPLHLAFLKWGERLTPSFACSSHI